MDGCANPSVAAPHDDSFALQRRADGLFQQADGVLLRFAARQLQQHILRMRRGERLGQRRELLRHQLQAVARHQLEAGQAGAAAVLHEV